MVTDTSGSMQATDVAPDPPGGRAGRGAGADQEAAGAVQPRARHVRHRAPSSSRRRPPTATRSTPRSRRCKVAGLDRDGRRPEARAAERAHEGDGHRRADAPGAGGARAALRRQERRAAEPVDIADQAKKLKVPIYTIALGTQTGVLHRPNGQSVPVPPDNVTLRDIADTTGGRFYAAPSAARLEDDLREPRHEVLDQEGQAGGHLVVRGRRARAAARRRRARRCCGWGGCREPPARDAPPPATRWPRRSARPSGPGPARSRRRSCATSTSRCCGGSRASSPASTSRRRSAAAPSWR